MNTRFRTVFTGFNITAEDLNDNNTTNIKCDRLYGKFHDFIQKLNTTSQITASYELQFVDTYFKEQPIVHSVKREIDFYVIPKSVYYDKNQENISLIKKHAKSKKIPLKNVLIINSRGCSVYPNRRRALPREIYNFFEKIYDQR